MSAERDGRLPPPAADGRLINAAKVLRPCGDSNSKLNISLCAYEIGRGQVRLNLTAV
jgi:hypothetical protein